MAEIIITGHRNPDMDSVCSAYAYADLKNRMDPGNRYVPIRCGNLNDATKDAFERIGVTPPVFLKGVNCRLNRVVRHGEPTLDWQDPVYKLVSLFAANPSVVGVTKEGKYYGLLSIDEVNRFFLRENSGSRPIYHFILQNIPKVLHGKFLKKGERQVFDGPILVGSMRFSVFSQHLEALDGQSPLLVVGDREEHIRKAIEEQVPCIILVGLEHGMTSDVDFSNFKGSVFVSEEDTSETIRLLRLSVPIDQLMDEELPRLDWDMLFDEAKRQLAAGKFRGMPVFQGEEWKGFVTRRCFLEKPKTKVILVDHNEKEQSVPGLDEAELVEIIDHHRMGTLKTPNPIYIFCDPLGSTCTIVSMMYERMGYPITKEIALVLLSGLISDTVILKSPTTTETDCLQAKKLAEIGGVKDLNAFGSALFGSGASFSGRDPVSLVEGDFKEYEEGKKRFGIGQCEVTNLTEVESVKQSLFDALEEVRRTHRLDFSLFLITDVIHENSILLSSGLDAWEPMLAYSRQAPHTFFLPGVLSRKKQLLPEVIRVLQEG